MHGSNYGMCGRCHGIMKLALGALLLINVFIWPQWLGIDGWIAFIAILMVIGGFIKLVLPSCGHCAPEKETPKRKRK